MSSKTLAMPEDALINMLKTLPEDVLEVLAAGDESFKKKSKKKPYEIR